LPAVAPTVLVELHPLVMPGSVEVGYRA
jgi:hypothetical protein